MNNKPTGENGITRININKNHSNISFIKINLPIKKKKLSYFLLKIF